MAKAPIYLWTGDGWGKSTSAFGAALRALGHDKNVVIIQFMKGRKEQIGEYKIKDVLEKLEVEQFGKKEWVDLQNPSEEDKELAKKGLEFAKQKAKEKPFLLILDEINLAVAIGLLDEKEVLDFLDEVPEETHVYLTGRNATDGLKERADFVNVINMLKGPKKLVGEEGIDY